MLLQYYVEGHWRFGKRRWPADGMC